MVEMWICLQDECGGNELVGEGGLSVITILG